jgi:site-specific recombinase XerD
LSHRQNLGYGIKPSLSHLRIFDRYLKRKKSRQERLEPLFFLEMRSELKFEPRSVNRIIASTRVFFHYLVRRGYYQENPVKDVPYLPEWTSIPYIFSENETDRLLEAVIGRIRQNQRYFLKDFSQYMAILLMARCGLRIAETIRLCRHQYRPDEKTLYIEKTKFKKDRLIPIPRPIWREMDNYLALRDAWAATDNPFLLAGLDKRSLCDARIRPMFSDAVKDIGLDQPRQRIANTIISPPSPHSLRHSFAVNILKQVKERGASAQNALPILAVYMGHSEYKHTVKYLKLADANHHRRITRFLSSKKACP